jgi:beta-phosphoglucomutase
MTSFAVIFDMDGVIADTNPYHKIALHQFAQKYGYDLTEQYLTDHIYGRQNKEWIPNLLGEMSWEQLKQYETEKEALFREIYKPHVQAVAGLVEFINLLELHQIPKAIGTSAPYENVDFILTHTRLTGRFQTILDQSHVDKGKPNPEIYLKAAKALGFPPEKCIVFEDSLSGVKAGWDAGCQVVGIMTTHTSAELGTKIAVPDFTQLSIQDLEKLFMRS